MSWFTLYAITNPVTTWGEFKCALISRFSDVHNEREAMIVLKEMKQWNHETIEDYYDNFLQLCCYTTTTK